MSARASAQVGYAPVRAFRAWNTSAATAAACGPAWLVRESRGEWAKLKASIDAGSPIPLGLVRDSTSVFDNHQVLAFGYDEADNLVSVRYPSNPWGGLGERVERSFNDVGQLTQVVSQQDGTQFLAAASYEPSGQPQSLRLDQGAGQPFPVPADRGGAPDTQPIHAVQVDGGQAVGAGADADAARQ